MESPLMIIELFLYRITDGGKYIFESYFNSKYEIEISSDVGYKLPDGNTIFFFYEPLEGMWYYQNNNDKPLNMVEFSLKMNSSQLSYEEAIEQLFSVYLSRTSVYRSNFPSALYFDKNDWPINFSFNKHKPSIADINTTGSFADLENMDLAVTEEALAYALKEPEDLEQDSSEEVQKNDKKTYAGFEYESQEEEDLHYFFKPGKKGQGIFYTASELIAYLNDKLKRIWPLTKEETGKLLNRTGFAISKGRCKGINGYYLLPINPE